MSVLLAVDPGESTGWALFKGEKLIDQGVVTNGTIGAMEWATTSMPRHDVLVLESFIVEPDFVGRAYASEVIGVLMLQSYRMAASGARVRAFQSRGQKATLIRGTETERFEWLRGHGFEGSTHELDAITHGLLRLRREAGPEFINRYWGTKKSPAEAGLNSR